MAGSTSGRSYEWGTVAYHTHDPNVPFVLNDIRRFAEQHERVILFIERPVASDVQLASNVEVVLGALDWSQFRPLTLFMRHLWSVVGIYLAECILTRRVLPPVHAFRKLLSNVFRAEQVIARLKQLDAADAWHYSFWFYDCIFVAWLRSKGRTRKAIARTHGGDLFEERGSLDTKALFRHFQFRQLDRVYSVSEAGRQYLQKRYPAYADKVATAYLGSTPPRSIPDFPTTGPLVVVSCARVRNVKRIHLIGEALCHVDIPVRWVHFGQADANSKDPTVPLYYTALEELARKPNVEVVRMGAVPNTAVLEWYASNPVHLFISMSENEGIPVSMMEAIGSGIPILSTDVGGCSEIVNARTGMLIPKDTSAEQVARSIERFASSPMNSAAYRSGVRSFWAEHFDMEHNYDRFFKEIHGR